MLKTSSPYIKYLYETKIKWHPFTPSTLDVSVMENKMIFIHLGNLLNVDEREAAHNLFCSNKIQEMLNGSFISIAIDSEDIPEATIVGLDLIMMNEKKTAPTLNILTMPDGRPFTSFSTLDESECLYLLGNAINAFKNKNATLSKAAEYMTIRLKNSGVILHRHPIEEIKAKILHLYVRRWGYKILEYNRYTVHNEYIIRPRFILFLLAYAICYKDAELLERIKARALEMVYSPMIDPIDGGVFLRSEDYALHKPTFEKSLTENAQSALLYAMLYKQFKNPIFRHAAHRTIDFIEHELKESDSTAYHLGLTINRKDSSTSLYYQYSLKDIKEAFPNDFERICGCIGMDSSLPETELQLPHNTETTMQLTDAELSILKSVRQKYAGELWQDKRCITAYNSIYSIVLGIISRGECGDDSMLVRAGCIIDNILSKRENNSLKIYRYISQEKDEYSTGDLHDYSMLLLALLINYKITGNEVYMSHIKQYATYIFLNYYQASNGMFSETSANEQRTPYKRESVIDYTRYSGNSIMAGCLLWLYNITKEPLYLNAFRQQISNISDELPDGGPFMVGWALQILNYIIYFSQKE